MTTSPFSWDRPPTYWQAVDLEDLRGDYEPQGEPCTTCGRNTESGRRYWCGTCLAITCEDCQDTEPCRACQRLHDDERDFAEVDGAFGLGLEFPCPNREGKHRHRVTMKGTQ